MIINVTTAQARAILAALEARVRAGTEDMVLVEATTRVHGAIVTEDQRLADHRKKVSRRPWVVQPTKRANAGQPLFNIFQWRDEQGRYVEGETSPTHDRTVAQGWADMRNARHPQAA
jgi:hypothetical protein